MSTTAATPAREHRFDRAVSLPLADFLMFMAWLILIAGIVGANRALGTVRPHAGGNYNGTQYR